MSFNNNSVTFVRYFYVLFPRKLCIFLLCYGSKIIPLYFNTNNRICQVIFYVFFVKFLKIEFFSLESPRHSVALPPLGKGGLGKKFAWFPFRQGRLGQSINQAPLPKGSCHEVTEGYALSQNYL